MFGRAEGAFAADIEWRVQNPFRFFQNAKHTQLHADSLRKISTSPSPPAHKILAMEHDLNAMSQNGWAAAIYKDVQYESCWVRSENCEKYLFPKDHTVEVRAPDRGGMCLWSIDKGPDRNAAPDSRLKPCREWTALRVPYEGNTPVSGSIVTLTVGGQVVSTTPIHVQDIVVAGIGDSFASGEGNPDLPADYTVSTPDLALPSELNDRPKPRAYAKWMDRDCHTSLYSHQLRVALQLSLTDPSTLQHTKLPHRSITFMHLGCSGAEIVDGLFRKYRDHRAQLSALISGLCEPGKAVINKDRRFKLKTKDGEIEETLYECPASAKMRDLDVLLMSIGGNDVEFSRLVAGVSIAKDWRNVFDGIAEIVETFGGNEAEFKPRYPDDDAFGEAVDNLKFNYTTLATAIGERLSRYKKPKVHLTAYPQIAYDHNEEICNNDDALLGMTVSNLFGLNHERARAAECAIAGGECVQTVEPKIHAVGLTQLQQKAADEAGWNFISKVRASKEFTKHGICAYSSSERATSSPLGNTKLPSYVASETKPIPYHPRKYRHYAQRSRWFRSPNDVYLGARTGPWVPKSLPNEKFALWIAYFGAFHPSAEGHAFIADMVFQDVANGLRN